MRRPVDENALKRGPTDEKDESKTRVASAKALKANRKKVQSVRLQLSLPPEYNDRLVELRDATRARTRAEVIRRALRVFEFLVEEEAAGNELVSRAPDGTITRIKLL